MATTLQLVNRVRRRLREEDVTAIGDDLSNALLDHLNEAKRDLLEAYTWDFDMRTDGELITMPSITGEPVVTNAGFDTITTALTQAEVVGQSASAKVIVTSDSSFGDTAVRIVSMTGSGLATLNLNIAWPGDSNPTATASVVFDEYVLPEYVRAVTSVRHQQGDLQVIETDRDIGMDSWAPRPQANLSGVPERVFVGKRVHATFNTADANTDVSGIGIKFDPTPSSTPLLFSYSYIYRHPDLAETQGLDDVDPSVEDLVVRLSEARAMISGIGGGDIETGAAMASEVFNRCNALKGNSRRDPMRRYVLGPTISQSFSGAGFGRFPRNFGSI